MIYFVQWQVYALDFTVREKNTEQFVLYHLSFVHWGQGNASP